MEAPAPLADYFVVVGLDEQEHPPADIWAKVRRDGHICEIATVSARDEFPLPEDGWAVATKTPTGRSATVNFRGMFPEDVFLCFRKGDGKPITDVLVVHEERGESIPEGYEAVGPLRPPADAPEGAVYDLSQKHEERQVVLCVSRALNKRPLRDIAVARREKEGFGLEADHEVLDRGLNLKRYGNDSFIAIARVPQVCFTAQPRILSKFPSEQRPECPMPGGDVSLFCMPTGVNIAHHFGPPLPTFFSFCLTVTEEGQRMYGCCVTFYEPLETASVRDRQDDEEYAIDLYTPKCMCLLSRWPFFDAFREFLVLLFTLSQGPNAVPIERRLYHLLYATPMPSYGTTIRVPLESSLISFARPPTVDFPLHDTSMMPLFRCLDIDNVLLLFKVMILEHKIVMHSKHKSLLLPAAETLCAIIFPFKFQHVYIPVMPTALADYLQAPVPYLIGMPTSQIHEALAELDKTQAILVDLDHNTVQVGSAIELPEFPTHGADVLRRELQLCASIFEPDDPDLENADLAFAGGGLLDRGVHTVVGEPFESRNVRSAFLRFFLTILREYRCCLRLPFLTPEFENIANPNQAELFADQQFRGMQPEQSWPFIDRLLETQSFMRFVEERTFPSPRPWDFIFFDRCIDTGVHDPPEAKRQRVFASFVVDGEADGDEQEYFYRPFVLKEEDFNLKGNGRSPGSPRHATPIVGLDTASIEGGPAAAEELQWSGSMRTVAMGLLQMVYACWFLLYRSYVRRKAEHAAQEAAAQAEADAPPKAEPSRKERLEALRVQRQKADGCRAAVASEGLRVCLGVVEGMHGAGTRVHETCYRSLMELCGFGKLADKAKWVFEDMGRHGERATQTGARPSVVAVRSPLVWLSRAEVVPDTITYNAFVQAIIKDEDEFSGAKFKSLRPYRCLPDGPPGDAEAGAGGRVSLRLCTEDGRQLGAEDEALALSVWACHARSYEDGACLPPLYIHVAVEGGAEGDEPGRYSFISPHTLARELEALLAHWGDSLATVAQPEPATAIRLREEHPTVFWCCVWYFRNAGLPHGLMLREQLTCPVRTKLTSPGNTRR